MRLPYRLSWWLALLPAALAVGLWPAPLCAQIMVDPGAEISAPPLPPSRRPFRGRGRTGGVEPVATGPAEALAGRVLSAADKHPLANATVQLSQQRTGREIATAVTDAEGHYTFQPQPAGTYRLRAAATGFRSQLYLEHEGFSTAIVLGQGLPREHLDFALVPGASVHGRVVDEAGEPVLRAQVQLYREATNSEEEEEAGTAVAGRPRVQRAGTTQTDEEGRYDLPDLQPGRYYVSISATPWYAVHPPSQTSERGTPAYRVAVDPALDVTYPEIFYPGATSDEGARAIVLKAGQRVAANVNLLPQRSISLQVQMVGGDDGRNGRGLPMLTRTVFGMDEPVSTNWSDFSRDSNTVTLTGLSPGLYRVHGNGPRDGSGVESSVRLGAGAAQTVDLSSTADRGDLRVHVTTVDGSDVPEGATVSALRQGIGRGQGVPVKAGVAEITGLTEGNYRLQVASDGDRWTVVRVRQDGKTVRGRAAQVNAGGTANVEVEVTRYAPAVHGIAIGPAHAPFAGAMLVLVPAGGDTAVDLFRRDESDLDGGFTFADVPPGNYLLVAIENGWGLPFANTTALEPYLLHGTPVVVAPSGPRTLEVPDRVMVQALR